MSTELKTKLDTISKTSNKIIAEFKPDFSSEDVPAFLLEVFDFNKKKGDLKKIEIIQAAIHCLSTIGIEHTTYDAIAELLHTRRAHIAYHFNDKNQIFISSIKYILANYQHMASQRIANTDSERPEDIIRAYVQSSFYWAKKYPHQVSVMLLLYYLCGINSGLNNNAIINEEYIKLNDDVRQVGLNKLKKIIAKKFPHSEQPDTEQLSLSQNEKCEFIARSIQNIMSSSLIDSFTTKNMPLYTACNNALKLIDKLLGEL